MNTEDIIFGIPIDKWKIAIDEAIGVSSDSPPDSFNFNTDAEALAMIINTCDTPLTIGIHGSWGSGKTSLMRLLKNILESNQEYCKIKTIWFDVLHYEDYDPLWGVFLVQIFDQLIEKYRLELIQKEGIKGYFWRIFNKLKPFSGPFGKFDYLKDWISSLESLALSFQIHQSNFGINISEKSSKNSFEDFLKTQRDRIKISTKFSNLIYDIFGSNGRVVVFIDNLDRLSPNRVLPSLEDFKRFLNIKGCIYVIGIEQESIELGLKQRFSKWHFQESAGTDESQTIIKSETYIMPRQYLEKYIQVPYSLRRPEGLTLKYLKDNYPQLKIILEEGEDSSLFSREIREKLSAMLEYLANAFEYNPRRIKVFINTLTLIIIFVYNRTKYEEIRSLTDINMFIDLTVLHFINTTDSNTINSLRNIPDSHLDHLDIKANVQTIGLVNLILQDEKTDLWKKYIKNLTKEYEWYFSIPQMKPKTTYENITKIAIDYLDFLFNKIEMIHTDLGLYSEEGYPIVDLIKISGSGETVSWRDIYLNPNHSLIIGKPGSGKTSILRSLSSYFTKISRNNLVHENKTLDDEYIPFLLDYKTFSKTGNDPTSSLDLIVSGIMDSILWNDDYSKIVNYCLESGKGIILVDNMSYLPEEDINKGLKALDLFIKQNPQWKVILTLDSRSFDKMTFQSKFSIYKIKELSDDKIAELIRTYCKIYGISDTNRERIISNALNVEDMIEYNLRTPLLLITYLELFRKKFGRDTTERVRRKFGEGRKLTFDEFRQLIDKGLI